MQDAKKSRIKNLSVEAVLRLIEKEQGNVPFIGHGMSPENVELVLRHPLVMVASDGYAVTCGVRSGKFKFNPDHPEGRELR